MLIENNNFAHIVIVHVVTGICILENKSIQENTEKRVVPIFQIT